MNWEFQNFIKALVNITSYRSSDKRPKGFTVIPGSPSGCGWRPFCPHPSYSSLLCNPNSMYPSLQHNSYTQLSHSILPSP